MDNTDSEVNENKAKMGKVKKIVYTPVRDWGRERRIIHGERHYVLDELTSWVALGKFQELGGQDILKAASERTEG